ncbi:type VII secretion-associated serine protease mycosin [Amorphoplanes nipponensis]|uniref:Type VII secretion-associated serine protease n=1 Tax=Actinoplanes nipponensis TaxID=135950 RepID=A0A919JMN2_9ACTN|nr:S8 family serine peptidase [Actinoplanes nipponensis]GIE52120.1 type VII secretion-associated serine protease [Actinoplanes nipponensis]
MRAVAGRRLAAATSIGLAIILAAPAPASADQHRDEQWYLQSLRIAQAHRITQGEGVTVAVIDSGVWAGHPDLKGAVLPGYNVLGKGDGREDLEGHGTGVAGIIAARGRSGNRGVLGVAPAAKVLPVSPAGSPLVVAKAIDWAVEHGAKVINMSFLTAGSDGLAAAVKRAADSDVVLVGGSGNNDEVGTDSEYPAAYPEVLAVGATDRAGKVAAFSHRGPQLDLTAPGVDIAVANGDPGREYQRVEGTSVSTAIVSGAAALIRAEYPALTAAQVVDVLESTAVDKGDPGRDDAYGFGELDVVGALSAAATVAPGPTTSAEPDVIAGSRGGDEGLPRLAIAGLGVLLLAGVVIALVAGLRRR